MGELLVVVLWVVAIWALLFVWRVIGSLARAADGNEFIKRFKAAYGRAPSNEVIWSYIRRPGTRHEERPDLFGESEG